MLNGGTQPENNITQDHRQKKKRRKNKIYTQVGSGSSAGILHGILYSLAQTRGRGRRRAGRGGRAGRRNCLEYEVWRRRRARADVSHHKHVAMSAQKKRN
jgi:hypothetical protein